ncbi:hypothetical protein GCM10023195_82970 [Actinoallomurus liliacearum]|uniref:Uncharacterized protein n=1 Tax=Actinoallomurus liliacearum TaxID=1080073 RepID=A0ABP8TZR9_9ACTN
MGEIKSSDLTWSLGATLNCPDLSELRDQIKVALNTATMAGLVTYEEMAKFVDALIDAMAGAEKFNMTRELGHPGISLRISIVRNGWSVTRRTSGRTKRYTVHITASAKPQLPQS